jgi:hypothetical protein
VSAAQIATLRADFEQHAREYCARSPLYGEICRAVASDDETLALMLHAPAHQRRPTLLQAAIHDLLLAGADHELATHVPTVAAGRGASGAAGPLALRFCREHRDALAHTLATRSTQTNEVNRAAALLPALVDAVPRGRRMRLVELGASAGLNLLLDGFDYRYGDRAPLRWPGAPVRGNGSRVVCASAVDGRLPALDAPPPIAQRIGVDLEPVDLRDPAASRWLLACVWPDELDRVARLRAAIELALADPPVVVRGDALALLASLAGPDGDDLHPVIWHSWVLAYWTPAAQRALAAAIDELGARRDLTWIRLEQPSRTAGLATPVVPGVDHDPADCALVTVAYRGADRTTRRPADVHGHAHHMRWFG